MKTSIFILLAVLAIISANCSFKPEITFGTLLKEMIDKEQLSEFPDPEYTTKQFSSYDRKSVSPDKPGWFANADRSQFIRTENNDGRREFVMFDADGPGAVVRFWVTVSQYQGNGTLRVYIDNKENPELEGEVLKLLSGGEIIQGPLATSVSDLTKYIQRGHNLYLPIPYNKHCKITYESDGVTERPGAISGEAFYYNINYRTYDKNVSVTSFTKDDIENYASELNLVQSKIADYDSDKLEGAESQKHERVVLKPDLSAILEVEGEKAIKQIVVQLSAENPEQALRSTVLEITFDGNKTVWCPVGDFFGTGYKISPYSTWYTKVTEDGTMACKWVMPFKDKCLVELKNLGNQEVIIEKFTVETTENKWSDRTMYFGAGWREDYRLSTREEGKNMDEDERERFDVNYVSLTGKGVLVGNGVVLFNTIDGWWGEGDEKIFVDGEKFPSHFGTGTEDFYGYAWSNPNNFSHPYIVQPDGSGAIFPGYVVNLRFRGLDAIPFNKSLQFDMEMWHHSKTTINHAPVSYWYMLPGGKTNLDPVPEQATRTVALSRLDFFLEGYVERNIFIDEGTVTINGRENGFEIRYTLDGSEPTINSKIYDGPFKLKKTTIVKSKGFSPKGYSTEILTGKFIKQRPLSPILLESKLQKGLKYDYYVLDEVLLTTKDLYKLEIDTSGVVEEIKYPDWEMPQLFGLIFRGYIKVKKTGVYSFYTNTNDGSMLYIHNQEVVNNDGPHGERERTGQIALDVGYHPIKVEYKQIGGGKHLEAFIEGSGIEKRKILPSELAH